MKAQTNSVDTKILDSVIEENMILQASAPTVSSSMSFQTLSHALSMAMESAALNQQKVNILSTTVTSTCVRHLLGDIHTKADTTAKDKLS
ncbi:RebB family R body protein [uncultured Kordia sp.]|uniref:RebB family R body protein n=1 Tax=uncultured Kordia sp. TaxID=507699 RepID=UPI00261E9806|nr:RebB family R body protein [uncultured Kordia sp.]